MERTDVHVTAKSKKTNQHGIVCGVDLCVNILVAQPGRVCTWSVEPPSVCADPKPAIRDSVRQRVCDSARSDRSFSRVALPRQQRHLEKAEAALPILRFHESSLRRLSIPVAVPQQRLHGDTGKVIVVNGFKVGMYMLCVGCLE